MIAWFHAGRDEAFRGAIRVFAELGERPPPPGEAERFPGAPLLGSPIHQLAEGQLLEPRSGPPSVRSPACLGLAARLRRLRTSPPTSSTAPTPTASISSSQGPANRSVRGTLLGTCAGAARPTSATDGLNSAGDV